VTSRKPKLDGHSTQATNFESSDVKGDAVDANTAGDDACDSDSVIASSDYDKH
jgi:hypothetical protein